MKRYHVLGLMSGTSLDGLDIAYCHIWHSGKDWDYEVRQCTTIAYDDALRHQLKNAIYLSQEAHDTLHLDYGKWLGSEAKKFIEKHELQVDFIASHGHTSHHRPQEGFTFQLGDGQQLSNFSGHKTVCDFRTLDVSLGGQGAPLVPVGDELLLPEYAFCLNLGGISNISFKKEGIRYAYDIGLANMPLNYVAEKLGKKYDKDGALAAAGILDKMLLSRLDSLPYYTLPYPKSTGYEWFSTSVIPLLDNSTTSPEDILHTLVHHNCGQIAKAIKAQNPTTGSWLLVTGGGALNSFFMRVLQKELGTTSVVKIPPAKFIAYKEALVFAFMGVLRVLEKTNVYCSVTGAKKDTCSGVVFLPQS